MRALRGLSAAAAALALAALIVGAQAMAATFVYVSNAEDGDLGVYVLAPDGGLVAKARTPAAKLVMPMAVSPDRRNLFAAIRSQPHRVNVYSIDAGTGALGLLSTASLPASMPYISLDRSGRFLFGASYGDNLVSVSAVGSDLRVDAVPRQVVPVGRNAHAILIDASNRYLFVPTLGTDQVFQFRFDAASGRLTANTPPLVQMTPGAGPRHFVFSPDNRFVYVLSELLATVTTFSLDGATGLLAETSVAHGLPPDSTLRPGAPRGPVGSAPPRDTSNDIWAADIHIAPNGKFLYTSERTRSTLNAFRVDAATGKLTYLGSTPTERQPRGFAIDPKGKYLVASGELSDTLSVYAIDQDSGALTLLGRYPAGKGANWVEIVGFD